MDEKIFELSVVDFLVFKFLKDMEKVFDVDVIKFVFGFLGLKAGGTFE